MLDFLAALAALLLAGSACATSSSNAEQAFDPRFEHALAQLGRAVEADDDEVARRILAGILAREPSGRALEVARSFEAVLDGRDFARELVLELRAESAPDGAGYRLALVCRSPAHEAVQLELAPPTLERLTTWAYAAGTEERAVESRAQDELSPLMLSPGETLVVDLGLWPAELGSAIARRDLWRMTTRSGTAAVGGRSLPIRAPAVHSAEAVTLAAFLPPEAVEPAVLAEYVQRERIAMPPLMERAVRIPLARRNEALALIAGVAPGLDDERLSEIAPALRWLSRTARLGGDPRAWRRALELGAQPEAPVPGLDLPDRPTR